jgi:hypothetical protein
LADRVDAIEAQENRIGLRIIGSVGREMAIQMPTASIRLWG